MTARKWYATVRFNPEAIAIDFNISTNEARKLLEEHEEEIQAIMQENGKQAISDIIEEELMGESFNEHENEETETIDSDKVWANSDRNDDRDRIWTV